MKTLITFFTLSLISINIFSQVLNYSFNDSTITTCSTTIFDSGNTSNNYQNNEDYFVTFQSSNGDCLELSFLSFDTEYPYDYLNIYDGDSVGSLLLASLSGNNLPANIYSSGTSITLHFHTDGSVTYSGFEININCTGNCYTPPPPPTNNDPCNALLLNADTICNNTLATTYGATTSLIDTPSCALNYHGNDVWFKVVIPDNESIKIKLSSEYPGITDAGMALYTGDNCNSLTEYSCNEQYSGYQEQYVNYLSEAGDTIWIRVWSKSVLEQGSFNICALKVDSYLVASPTVYTVDYLVNNLLGSNCISIDSANYNGDSSAIGYFTDGYIIGFQSGIILGNGPIVTVTGNNAISDNLNYTNTDTNTIADLTEISQSNGSSLNLSDLSVLDFYFKPSFSSISFNFVFASEEYNAFECTAFNDIFALFISGSNISGAFSENSINLAVVPGTASPITVSTINGPGGIANCGAAQNEQYYIDHPLSNNELNARGYTVPLTATANNLIPNEMYHIRIAIADAGDASLNSFVFIKEHSFITYGNNNCLNILQQPQDTSYTLNVEIENPSGNETYQWFFNGSLIVDTGSYSGTTTNQMTINQIIPSYSGNYYCLITDSCCSAVSNTVYLDINTGQKNISNQNISIYPNPTNGLLKIETDKEYQIIITNVSGKKIINKQINKKATINLSDNKSGIYFIKFISKNNTFVRKIILE